MRSENGSIKIEEVTVTDRIATNIVFVSALENIKFRIVLLGVYKKSSERFYFNPTDDTLLEVGDILLIIGNYMFIKEFTKYLSKKIGENYEK